MGVLAAGASSGCGSEHAPPPVARDAGHRDAGGDAGDFDGGPPHVLDGGPDDGGPGDGGRPDAPGLPDTGAPDTGPIPDAGTPEGTEIPGPTGPRARHVAVTLDDGRIFVAGGTD